MLRSLFKYCHPKRAEDMIAARQIRFSPVECLNDPFEALPNMDFLQHPNWVRKVEDHLVGKNLSELRLKFAREGRIKQDDEIVAIIKKQIRVSMDSFKTWIDAQGLEVVRRQREALRILSFSQQPPDDPKALLIWSHYTDGHRGFVVEFDSRHPFPAIFGQRDHGRMAKIQYRRLRPSMDVGGDGNVVPGYQPYFTKSLHWRYEREYRIVTVAGHRLLDRSKCDALADLPPEFIRCIVLGAECSGETRKTVLSACRAKELRHVRLQQAQVDLNHYNVTVRDL